MLNILSSLEGSNMHEGLRVRVVGGEAPEVICCGIGNLRVTIYPTL